MRLLSIGQLICKVAILVMFAFVLCSSQLEREAKDELVEKHVTSPLIKGGLLNEVFVIIAIKFSSIT